MQEIKCPKCGEVFQVDEAGYAQIVRQVRDKEFTRDLEQSKRALEDKQRQELELLRMKEAKERETEITEKERIIAGLQAKLEAAETARKLAVAEALEKKNEELARRDSEIVSLKGELKSREAEGRLNEKSLKEQYEERIKLKEEELAYYKDFKARQSTKMIGESLEQHCLAQFNSLRATAFPGAYFEKDNEVKNGSKGDFIYRECAEDGTELLSIMFEMKNEADTTATKHKNEDFLKELDKDRRDKECEYAILVSLLEGDNELYNGGIVDVSYRYPKMYVVRPQFFIPIIGILRNAAQNSLHYRQELQAVRNQQLDIQHFEENMQAFKEGFSRNYRLASERFRHAIEEIDKTISHLQKTKEDLLSSENNLRLANNKAEELSIKRLTRNAPSVKEMFEKSKKEE